MFERLDGTIFDWLAWKNGTILDVLRVQSRYDDVVKNRKLIRKYAVGWCPGEQLYCRPKENHVGVMFLVDEQMFWTHFTNKEFKAVFQEMYETA